MYYIENYYTGKIIDVTSSFETAFEIAKNTIDSQIVNEENHILYANIELPF